MPKFICSITLLSLLLMFLLFALNRLLMNIYNRLFMFFFLCGYNREMIGLSAKSASKMLALQTQVL